MKIQGVNLNEEALKGYSRAKFIKQYSHMFKNIEAVADEIGVAPAKKSKKKQKIEEKLDAEKVTKPEFD